ncbi:MAG: alpha/beta hydrolase, partial [Methylocystis sp.]|nr:alpha/beta hydrolase [Methylocystis sp.]
MADLGIDDIRALLSAKPRPVGWPARRARIEDVGAAWPSAPDISLARASIDGMAAEWSCAPTSDPSRALLFF